MATKTKSVTFKNASFHLIAESNPGPKEYLAPNESVTFKAQSYCSGKVRLMPPDSPNIVIDHLAIGSEKKDPAEPFHATPSNVIYVTLHNKGPLVEPAFPVAILEDEMFDHRQYSAQEGRPSYIIPFWTDERSHLHTIGGSMAITGSCPFTIFRAKNMTIEASDYDGLSVADIKCANICCMAGSGILPARLFKSGNTIPLIFPTVTPANKLSVTLISQHGQRIRCAVKFTGLVPIDEKDEEEGEAFAIGRAKDEDPS